MSGRSLLAGMAWPLLSGLVGLALWEGLVRAFDIPVFLLPAPTAVAATIAEQWSYLISQLAITVMAAGLGLIMSVALGLALGAAARRIPVVIDGFISTAAAAVAVAIEPRVKDFLFASHRSTEPGHDALLKFVGLEPFLCLDMRLGEGTGAALAMPVLDASVRLLKEMATFSSASVSESNL